MTSKIYLNAAPWPTATIHGRGILVNEAGVMRTVHADDISAEKSSELSPELASAASGLSCALVPASITIESQTYDAVMCVRIYRGLIAILTETPDKTVRTTTYSRISKTAGAAVGKLIRCCG